MTYPTPSVGAQGISLAPLTSAQVAAAPTQANFNALQADVAAIHTALAALLGQTQAGADQGQGAVSGAPTYTGGLDTAGDQGPGTPDA